MPRRWRSRGRSAHPVWTAGLLKRTFALEVFACLRCEGRRSGVALVEAGPFHMEIGRVYALDEAAKAQQEVLKHHLGKFVM